MTQEISKDVARYLERHGCNKNALVSFEMRIASVLSSVIVATFTQKLSSFWIKVFAATSTTAVILIETAGIGHKENGFRQAYQHPRIASMRFRKNEFTLQI